MQISHKKYIYKKYKYNRYIHIAEYIYIYIAEIYI